MNENFTFNPIEIVKLHSINGWHISDFLLEISDKMNRKQPNADTVGRDLENKGYVAFSQKKFNQTSNNCFDIACYLAEKFGYQHPQILRDLGDKIRHNKSVQLGWEYPSSYENLSEACFVIRSPESLSGLVENVHVVFELFGKEYNYGAITKHGFPIERRLYLRKKDKN